MKKILIIGAGAMGSAFTIPCADNNNEVTLVGTHLENELITSIKNLAKLGPVGPFFLGWGGDETVFGCNAALQVSAHFPALFPAAWRE